MLRELSFAYFCLLLKFHIRRVDFFHELIFSLLLYVILPNLCLYKIFKVLKHRLIYFRAGSFTVGIIID